MANLPGGAFAKGRDRIVRIAPTTSRLECTFAANTGAIVLPNPTTALSYEFLKGATKAEFTPSPNSQEFYLLGDNGWRDSVGVTQAGELACSAYFINDLAATTFVPTHTIDPALLMVLGAESNPDVEIWVEMFTFLGIDTASSDAPNYHIRAFSGSVTSVSESAPSDGLIEYSWTFQSRGEVFAGTLALTAANTLDVYA